jgi:hypothetical protein
MSYEVSPLVVLCPSYSLIGGVKLDMYLQISIYPLPPPPPPPIGRELMSKEMDMKEFICN